MIIGTQIIYKALYICKNYSLYETTQKMENGHYYLDSYLPKYHERIFLLRKIFNDDKPTTPAYALYHSCFGSSNDLCINTTSAKSI